ncbi:hypothetical protein B0A55_02336 [Friedmanniomyces simplex]|uniref:F-box domain-containing protein n=1 Tax=Friedmanniomyces simplex TaxID=329884 RepID=A0A4U0XWK7_9PEZI|nr:hypothetical protein B0A55_02336 [Friedmanniomyces simplex]
MAPQRPRLRMLFTPNRDRLTWPVPADKVTPPEVLTMVFGNLNTAEDVHSTRLVSQNFREAAWPAFGRTFNHKVFHLTRQGVTALRLVSLCERVVPYIKHLHISALRPHERGLDSLLAWGAMSCDELEPLCRYTAWEAYQVMVDENEEDKSLGTTTETLAAALGGLRVLENITLVGGDKLYVSPAPPNTLTSQSGATLLFSGRRSPRWHNLPSCINIMLREAEQVVTCLYDHYAYAPTLRLLFDGLATSGSTTCNRIRRFCILGAVQFDELSPFVNADPHAPPFSNAGNTVAQLGGLTHLELRIDAVGADSSGSVEATIARIVSPLPAFLTSMRNITSLRLSFPADIWDVNDRLLANIYLPASADLYGLATNHLAGPPSTAAGSTSLYAASRANNPLTLHFPHLKDLYLGNLVIDTCLHLRAFLGSHATTLRTLRLQAVQVASRDEEQWIHFLYSLHAPRMQLEVFVILPFMDAAHQRRLEEDPRTMWVRLDERALKGCATKAEIVGGYSANEGNPEWYTTA